MRTTMRDSLSAVQAKGKGRKLGNNTFEYHKDDGTRVVRLHTTDVLEFRPDGKIVLNSSGWQTVTTKARLNEYLPRGFRVYSEKGLWRVRSGERSIPFRDGMILPDAFDAPTGKADKIEKAQRKLAKQIANFVGRVDKVESLPMPDSGDCWFCSMFDRQEPHDRHTHNGYKSRTGDRSANTDHLAEHVKEGYLHGSLLVNAMRWAGYRDDQIRAHYQLNIRRTFKSSLRRYLRSQLGLPV